MNVDGVLQALDAGDFYASTGVALADLRSTRGEIALEIESGSEARFTTVFTGQRGVELHVSDSLSPRYPPFEARHLCAGDRLLVPRNEGLDPAGVCPGWLRPRFGHGRFR